LIKNSIGVTNKKITTNILKNNHDAWCKYIKKRVDFTFVKKSTSSPLIEYIEQKVTMIYNNKKQ